MRRTLSCCLILMICQAVCAGAGGDTWNRIRYSGGTVQPQVDAYDWDTALTVSHDAIVMAIARGKTVRIAPADVTALSYGQVAHRRVADMVALSMIVTPLALFGILHQSKNHFVGIEWRGADGKPAAALLAVHKDQYGKVLEALKTVTGKPVAAR